MEIEDKESVMVQSSIYTSNVTVDCPNCGCLQDGFLANPAGLEFKCDCCGDKYKVHSEADIEFR